MTVKTDVRKSLDSYRARRGEFRLVEVPPLRYLAVDGHGDPNTSPGYARALEVLYPLAYALKFASRAELGRDYVIPPLEGLWWAADMAVFTRERDKSAWDWTMMLMTPHWLGAEHVAAARESVAARKPSLPVERVRVEVLDEGLCAQTLHIGSFDAEGPVLDDLHTRFVPEQGLVMRGKHHEIYLSDPRRTAPDRLRTILRQPVGPARPERA
ncbi:GyrI-like domain-containing protein [Kineococcus glutinatus]|uniref:GyrI-like domain-containing protein n=1 Tax=Kineococcus glutinatus TaxID=1070872 RepID=UPI0031E7099A